MRAFNASLGIDVEQEKAMLAGCLFGWEPFWLARSRIGAYAMPFAAALKKVVAAVLPILAPGSRGDRIWRLPLHEEHRLSTRVESCSTEPASFR